MMNLRQTIILGTVLLLPIAFNQCGRADFQQVNRNDALNGTKGVLEAPIVDPVDPAVIAKICGENPTQTQNFDITFAENKTEICEWDNTAEIERHFGAMRMERKPFSLPANSTLCDLAIESSNQDFQYDDYFVLTLNRFVIAASEPVPLKLATDQRNPMVYEWAKLKDQPFNPSSVNTEQERNNWDAQVWCARGTSGATVRCEFPASDTNGPVRLQLPDKVFQGIVANNPKRTNHSLDLILIGDNDKTRDGKPIDCAHKKIDLKLRATFVQNP